MANHQTAVSEQTCSQADIHRHKLNTVLYEALMEKKANHVLRCCKSLLDGDGKLGPLHIISIHKDTVLHMACYSKQKDLSIKLLEIIQESPDLKRRLAETTNDVGNTVLHDVATNNAMMEVARKVLDIAPGLLTSRNILGETPLFRAARYGKHKMFELLADELDRRKYAGKEEARRECLRRNDGTTVLHISIFTENFDLALSIAERYGDLISARDCNQMTALQHLACNPSAFLSGSDHSRLKQSIYSRIASRDKAIREEDVDSCQDPYESTSRTGEVPRFRWPIWEEILEEKHKYDTASRLARKLLESDTSWEKTNPHAVDRGAPTKSSSLVERKEEVSAVVSSKGQEPSNGLQVHQDDVNNKGKTTPPKGHRLRFSYIRSKETPLFLATMSGIPEIVEEILKKYPQAIEHYNDQGRNILHVAINYRQIEIFDMVVKTEMTGRRLLRATDAKGNSILHMVGKKSKRWWKSRSPAFQLQEELLLFERVKEYSKSHFLKVLNHKKQTADELFASNYHELHEDAKEWLKRTAEHCTIVAVLIATVAFAAAYTVPGGPSQDTGTPLLLYQPFFVVFTLADVICLTYALTSVITFLSILTSPFQLEDFKHFLLRKLMMGLTFLILSVSMMMVAFGATIILMIRDKQTWTKIVMYTVAFLPVVIFGLSYSPLYYRLLKACSRVLKCALKLCPRCTCFSPLRITGFFKRREPDPESTRPRAVNPESPSLSQVAHLPV